MELEHARSGAGPERPATLRSTSSFSGWGRQEKILEEEVVPADYAAFPRVTFTDPEVGAVGLHGPGNEGLIKLVVDRTAGMLVGMTSVGPHGGETLGLLSAIVHAKVPLRDVRHMIYAYPTSYGAVGETLGAYAQGIGKVIDPAYATRGVLEC